MYKCINFKIRQKNYKKYFFCSNIKEIISFSDCENCSFFKNTRNKPIKKVGKNKISVKKDIYDEVYKRDNGKCQLRDCTCNGGLELHHIKYRSEAKDLINEPTNCVILCTKHHKEVHSNKHYWQPILKEMISE